MLTLVSHGSKLYIYERIVSQQYFKRIANQEAKAQIVQTVNVSFCKHLSVRNTYSTAEVTTNKPLQRSFTHNCKPERILVFRIKFEFRVATRHFHFHQLSFSTPDHRALILLQV